MLRIDVDGIKVHHLSLSLNLNLSLHLNRIEADYSNIL
jgi:hypothetical protein